MSNNLQRLLFAILNFLIAVTVLLYHIVQQYILEQKDLYKVHFTSGEHLANFHLPQVNITVFSADHNSQILVLVNSWDLDLNINNVLYVGVCCIWVLWSLAYVEMSLIYVMAYLYVLFPT